MRNTKGLETSPADSRRDVQDRNALSNTIKFRVFTKAETQKEQAKKNKAETKIAKEKEKQTQIV